MEKTDKDKEIKRIRGFYEIKEGVFVPSVTTVIYEVLAAPQLRYWYGKVGNEEAGRIGSEAKSFGSAMHKFVAEYLRTKQLPVEDTLATNVRNAWNTWLDWWSKNPVEPELVEEVIHNDTYAGTCDLSGEGWLIDWKFANGIYDSHKVQLGAYARLLGVEKAKIVRISKDENDLEVLEMNKEELEAAAEVFNSLLKVFWWKRGGK